MHSTQSSCRPRCESSGPTRSRIADTYILPRSAPFCFWSSPLEPLSYYSSTPPPRKKKLVWLFERTETPNPTNKNQPVARGITQQFVFGEKCKHDIPRRLSHPTGGVQYLRKFLSSQVEGLNQYLTPKSDDFGATPAAGTCSRF